MRGAVIITLLFILLAAGIASAGSHPKEEMTLVTPMYVANPATGECKYFFPGDAKHVNPRPENFTINIAYVTEIGSVSEACEAWKCVRTRGQWYKDGLCMCPGESTGFDNVSGCIGIEASDDFLNQEAETEEVPEETVPEEEPAEELPIEKIELEIKRPGFFTRFFAWLKSLF